jgi:hypothetical protein
MWFCFGISKALMQVCYIMGFLSTSLLCCFSCLCRIVCILLWIMDFDCVLVSQTVSFSNTPIFVSHPMNMELLSYCSILILISACLYMFYRSFLFGVLASYSYTKMPVVWHLNSAEDIGQSLIGRRREPACTHRQVLGIRSLA